MINTILIGSSFLVVLIVLFSLYQKSKLTAPDVIDEDYATLEELVEAVKMEMVEIIKEDPTGVSDREYNSLIKRKARIKDALNQSVHAVPSAKLIVLELIRGFIAENVSTERVEELVGISEGMMPSDHVMYEILMYKYKQEHGIKAMAHMMDKYDLARERIASDAESDTDVAYFMTIEDLHHVYDQEAFILSDDEKIDVLAVLVYQKYKGFGILDTLREMDINGFNCGTSGSIAMSKKAQADGTLKATNSVWLFYKGKFIHLRFMNFGSEEELKRIVQLMSRYNNPGSLTAKKGYLVNTMHDKSRVLALRPPASEYWAIFVRKFMVSDPSPKNLLVKPHTKNAHLVIRLLEYLLRGQVTVSVSGRQGSGKTTLMASIIRYIDPRHTLRILEMAPELYLREIYPSRNILSVQETPTVSASQLQDALKKSDAAVSIVGEVATDEVAARMIQLGMTASLFTIFSHHANTAEDLVYTLRNSLVNAGGFSNMSIAERQVTEVVKMDVHLDYTADGDRFVERITEIIPLSENVPYPEYDESQPVHSMNVITREYYRRRTDRISFMTRDILRYDKRKKTYYTINRISPSLETRMRSNIGDLIDDYDKFMFLEWGRRKYDTESTDEVIEAVLEKYDERYTPDNALTPESPSAQEGYVIYSEEDKEKSLKTITADLKDDFIKEQEEFVTTKKEAEEAPTLEEHEDDQLFFDFFDGDDD